jgi:hypothetical protein
MTAMQQMIERINARLATLERETRDPRHGWLTRLMLAGPRTSTPENGTQDACARVAIPR